ncbi:O-antigen ligase family protein [Catellatospora tritici]|uniref:O-antigen ligase family protein n=1 Tax=Catellatospora tritici TaxID=2851566 RepID=UPI001C2D13ED|nr:O-antigen ligase domain-containing protein [Catellatospora tritici]MBV1853484.1 O-antigen ligase domain-containing protein [Catellatospora tritici]
MTTAVPARSPEPEPSVRAVAAAPPRALAAPPLLGHRARQRDPMPLREWALFAMIVLYPVGWLLGLTLVWIPLLAVPMALELFRRGRVKLPAPFALWALLIFLGLVSSVMLGTTVPGALPPEMSIGRILAYVQRMSDLAAAGVVLLYIGNLTERELPTKRVVKMLAGLFVVLVIGGLAGMVLPRFTITTPLAEVLPKFLISNGFVRSSVKIELSQWQSILEEAPRPRPAAPFQYTNTWGQCLVLLLPWFLIATLHNTKSLWRRFWAIGVLALAMVPTVFSLNRGMWLGLGLAVAYLTVRLAIRGSVLPVVGVMVGVALVGIITLTTPLGATVMERINTPHSNEGRASLNGAAVTAAMGSPIIGYGGQSETIGSERSIAIGQSASCEQCGNRDIGSDGQLWALLITQGFVGAGLYILFFLWMGWRFRREHSWIGIAGGLVVPLALWFMTIYNSGGMTLVIMMAGLGLMWRNATTKAYR